MGGHLRTLLESFVSDPQRRLSAFSIQTDAERQLLITGWNETASPFPEEACIHHLFEAQAKKTPDTVALAFGNQQLTYRELDELLRLMGGTALLDLRRGKNMRHLLRGLLRQSVFGCLAGYEDVNDTERLSRDPAMRAIVDRQDLVRGAA